MNSLFCFSLSEVLLPVFWFSYVLELHKLKMDHFQDLIQVIYVA